MAKMKLSPVQSSISRIMGGMAGLTETIDKQLGQKRTQAEIALLTRLRDEWTEFHGQMHTSFLKFLVERDEL